MGLRPPENNAVEQASGLSRLRGEKAGVSPSGWDSWHSPFLVAASPAHTSSTLPSPDSSLVFPLCEPSLSCPDSQTHHVCPDSSIWITRRIEDSSCLHQGLPLQAPVGSLFPPPWAPNCPRITSQLTCLHLNLCLRICFSGNSTRDTR